MKYAAAALLLFSTAAAAGSYWNFDEASGTKAVADSGLVLTLRGTAAWRAQGKYGTALNLAAATAYADAPDATLSGHTMPGTVGGPQQFTLSAWIRPSAVAVRNPILAKQGSSVAGARRGFLLSAATDDGKALLTFEVFKNETAGTAVVSTTALKRDTWQHIAATYDYRTDGTSVIALYIDGKPAGSSTKAVGPVQGNPQPLEVGRYLWGSNYSRYFAGAIDELRIQPRVLAPAQIQQLFAALPAPAELAQVGPGCTFVWNYPADQISRIENFFVAVNDTTKSITVPRTQLFIKCDALALTPGEHTIYVWAYSATEKKSSTKAELKFAYADGVALAAPSDFRVE